MSKFEKALKCPTCVYNIPQELLDDDSLTKDEKVQILKQWEIDARHIITADDENMVGDNPCMLNRLILALAELE